MRIVRLPGRVRSAPEPLRREQWMRALFAYAELHHNPGLMVNSELERARTVPASRWLSHRLLLDAHAALLCRLSRSRMRRLRAYAASVLRVGASIESVETGLGEFQEMNPELLVEGCPFFRGEHPTSTFWEGWVSEPEAEDEPARTVSVRLTSVKDCEPQARSSGSPNLVVVAGHAGALDRENHVWGEALEQHQATPLELRYSFWTHRLGLPDAQGYFRLEPSVLIDALQLSSGRSAWAVGARVVEAAPSWGDDGEQALGAAVELVATLSRGQSDAGEQPWQSPVMSAAETARESVAAILDAFAAFGASVYEGAWRSDAPTCIFDSKYLYAASPAREARTLELRVGRYQTGIEVAIGRDPATSQPPAERGPDASAGRWSMLRFRSPKPSRKTGEGA